MLKRSRHSVFQSCFYYALIAPKSQKHKSKHVHQARIKPDILSILSPNPTGKVRLDLKLSAEAQSVLYPTKPHLQPIRSSHIL